MVKMADEFSGYRDGYSDGRIDILRELKQSFDDEKDLSIVKDIIDEKIKDWEDWKKKMAENKITIEEIQRYIFDKRCQGNPPRTPREIYDCLQLAYEYGRISMTYVYPSQSKEKNDGR